MAILGLLTQGALHGYELRKRVTLILGPFRSISFGSVYPELKRLSEIKYLEKKEDNTERGLIKRAKISYQITPIGTQRLNQLLKSSGPETWEDDTFTTYLSFFAKIASSVRLQILQGRKFRLQEKINFLQDQLTKTDLQLDNYNFKLNNYNLDLVKREIKWIEELISSERKES